MNGKKIIFKINFINDCQPKSANVQQMRLAIQLDWIQQMWVAIQLDWIQQMWVAIQLDWIQQQEKEST